MDKMCHACGTINTIDAERCVVCNEIISIKPINKSTLKLPAINRNAPFRRNRNHTNITTNNSSWSKIRGRFINKYSIVLAIFLILLIITIPIFINILRKAKINNNSQSISLASLPDDLGERRVGGPNGQMIGINDGSFAPFDLGRSVEELNFKKEGCDALRQGQGQKALSLWRKALTIDSSDAEALIYIENQRILISGKRFVTLVAGIGFSVSFEQGANQSDQEMLQGIYTAQLEYNLHNNLQLRIFIANSGGEESYVPLIAQQIVHITSREKIVGVLGWLASAPTLLALPILSNSGIPMISPEATSDELSGISPYFFRVVPPNSVQAKAGATFAENTLHPQNIVVFSDPSDSYSQNLAQDFINQFIVDHYHVTSHVEDFTTSKTGNFPQLIDDALKYSPDLFYFTSSQTSDSGAFENQLPTKGPYAKLPVLSGDAGYAIHPNSYGRWFFTSLAFADEWDGISAQIPKFFQEYKADFDPNNVKGGIYDYGRAREEAILSYDAASVTLQGLFNIEAGKQDLPSTQDLTNALSQIRGSNAFQGVSGQISFGDNHDPMDKAVLILYASGGGFTQGYPPIGCFLKKCSR